MTRILEHTLIWLEDHFDELQIIIIPAIIFIACLVYGSP